jgi:hypothetical protein
VKKLTKFVLILAFVFGGWALAAASLHVVRGPGTMLYGYVPVNVQLVPKTNLTFHDTYVDTTKWSAADVATHPAFVERLRQANKADLVTQASERPSPADAQASARPTTAVEKPSAPAVTSAPAQKSIFDYDK